MEGWRITVVEDKVAIDNKELIRQAAEKGERPPDPVFVVLPVEVIKAARHELIWDR